MIFGLEDTGLLSTADGIADDKFQSFFLEISKSVLDPGVFLSPTWKNVVHGLINAENSI